MDSSQNSDIFSDNSVHEDHSLLSCNNQAYQTLVKKTKKFLCLENLVEEPDLITKFSSCLEDCNICITKCLESISSILEDVNASLDNLHMFLKDANSLLQVLTNFLNNIIDSIILSCSDLKTFPITTGSIILTIFAHCKDSEHLYGNHLNSVEIQLKDLFHACNQLQLIYLKILEKYFIFDFMDKNQQYVLTKALKINLRICEIVQVLDVKTMAEQWKAFTAICEKYISRLLDENIYNHCSELLCNVIEINLKSALEKDAQDKIFLKSIKVASFCIKLLTKMSNIFKCGTTNNYENVVHLLICIHKCDGPVIEMKLNKSEQFITQMNLLIVNTSHGLTSQLLHDERFINSLLQFDIKNVNDEKRLGYMLLLISIIKCSVRMPSEISSTSNEMLINCMFNVIPYSCDWFHSGLMFKNEDELSGLEDHLLAHAAALCASLGSEEFATLERRLYENILSTNVFIAMFTSRLWILLARLVGSSYTFSLLSTLCKIYEKLDNVDLFNDSLQKIYLGNVMNRLFEDLPLNDKVKLKNQFEIEESHYSLWSVLKIKNLPENTYLSVHESLIEKLLINLNKLSINVDYQRQDMQLLITTMKVLSTCSFTELNPNLEKCVVAIWIKACPRSLFSGIKDIDPGTHWYYSLLESIIPLTDQIVEQFDFENVFKIFKIMSNIVLTGNNDLQLLLLPTYCKISFYSNVNENELSIDTTIDEVFKYLLSETNYLIKRYTLNELVKYSSETTFKSIVLKRITESAELKNVWQDVVKVNRYNINDENELTVSLADCNFIHKCANSEIKMEDPLNMTGTMSESNFEIDIDNLFDDDSVSKEPVSKKAKLDEGETEMIIKRMEEDSLLLHQMHGISDEGMKRIAVVYNRLRNIIA